MHERKIAAKYRTARFTSRGSAERRETYTHLDVYEDTPENSRGVLFLYSEFEESPDRWVDLDTALTVLSRREEMPFGGALDALWIGLRVKRKDWDQKWLYLVQGFRKKVEKGEPYYYALNSKISTRQVMKVEDRIDLVTAEGTVLPGWTPTQQDMLACDWCCCKYPLSRNHPS